MLIFSFSKSAQSLLLSWPLNSPASNSNEAKTGCANSVGAPTWDIQRRRDRFSNIYIEKEWLGNPHSFVKISGGRSMTLFCLPFLAGSSASPTGFSKSSSWRTTWQHISFQRWQAREPRGDETKFHEQRYSQLHKSNAVWSLRYTKSYRVTFGAGRRNCLRNICIKTCIALLCYQDLWT